MNIRTATLLVVTHATAVIAGFGAGVYALPILVAPPAPADTEITEMASRAEYAGKFTRDLQGSDALHWGEGTVSVGKGAISFRGRLAPGPDYKLYLSPQFVETESDFNRLKNDMVRIGDVRTFENFVVDVPPGIDPANYTSVIVWCESFGQFITSARYR